jgi:hypothetical protein
MALKDLLEKHALPRQPEKVAPPVVNVGVDLAEVVAALKSMADRPAPCPYVFTIERDAFGRVERIVATPQSEG